MPEAATESPSLTRGLPMAWARLPLALWFLFVVALGIRLQHINDPPLGFHETRQYRSLIIARDYYFEGSPSIPAWKQQVAHVSRLKQGVLEPPILEFLVSIGYRALGGERLWLPQLLSTLFWLVGAGFLFQIGRRIGGLDEALFSVAFYLFLPFAVVASRSVQPDPLMVMLILASLWAILRYHDVRSGSRLGIAAVISALAFLVKPGSVFAVVGVFVALEIFKRGVRSAAISRSSVAFVAITLLPTLMAYAYGMLTGRFLLGEATKTVLPQLWVSPFFWRSWLNNIGVTVGFIPFVLALLGMLLLREGVSRAFMLGLWLGYVAFGLAFNYNVATHDYYQLQLIPIVGLSIGPIMALVMNQIRQLHPQRHWRLAAWTVLLLALVLSVRIARARLVNPDVGRKVMMQQEIGDLVQHSTRTIFLSADYGVPLEYHGLLSGLAWPLASDLEWERLAGVPIPTAEQRFKTWFSGTSPEYFIVEDLREFEQQPDLRRFLSASPIVSRGDHYVVFNVRGR
jgi:4-amino-4-deoxy-L-arabinose transferase-like glycosyltransferase